MSQASALLLFGATGDLATRMLLPSLYGLDTDGFLPADFRIVATARTPMSIDEYRAFAASAIGRAVAAERLSAERLQRFTERLVYAPVDARDAEAFRALSKPVETARGEVAIFLSTAPDLFAPTIAGLSRAGLVGQNVRVALEKPLGHDLASSRSINDAVATAFPEDRTFRIDHYLGKETVQNLLALRFGNALFEPLWRSAGVHHVQITVAETVGLESRLAFYDGAGALRDMVQNHMLQLLALVAMEPPAEFEASAIRAEKVKVLRALRPIDRRSAPGHSVIGQYVAGAAGDAPVPGYTQELGHPSDTETFVALKAQVDNWRWKGVPFYLRTGKRLPTRRSEIVIQFRDVPHSIFARGQLQPNKLVIRLQPDENIRLLMMTKQPGLDRGGLQLREVPLEIGVENPFTGARRRIAYERLLLDLIAGDSTLFVRRDEVEAQWTWIDAIRDAWAANGMRPLPYEAGAWGPPAAARLAEQDGVIWRD